MARNAASPNRATKQVFMGQTFSRPCRTFLPSTCCLLSRFSPHQQSKRPSCGGKHPKPGRDFCNRQRLSFHPPARAAAASAVLALLLSDLHTNELGVKMRHYAAAAVWLLVPLTVGANPVILAPGSRIT